MERVIFYVDGFNFHYGLKNWIKKDSDWQKFYWLDYVKFFHHFIGESQILQKVIYFAAPPPVMDAFHRFYSLINANTLLNPATFETVMGQFYRKSVTCKVCKSNYPIYEEKRTDVNIAMRLVSDCMLDEVDTIVLVSADSDLVPPLQLIKDKFPTKKVRVYFPPGNNSIALVKLMKENKKDIIRLERSKIKFFQSVMPDTVTIDGTSYTIPPKWKV